MAVAQQPSDDGCGIRPLDVVLVIDRSGSMGNQQTASGTPAQVRMVYAKQAAKQLVDDLQANGGVGGANRHMVGVTSYGNSTATVNVQLGAGATSSAVKTAIDGLNPNGNTPLKQGMAAAAADMLAGDRTEVDGLEVRQVLIILSDGQPYPSGNRPNSTEIANFKAAADEVFSIAIGQGGSGAQAPDLALMESLAKPGDGSHYYHVTTGDQLPDIFSKIFDEIACSPDIEIEKSADVSSLPASGGEVNYRYEISNPGNVMLTNIQVSDDKCGPVEYVEGDTNVNSGLDVGETWVYACVSTLTSTTTNVATAIGWYGDTKVSDTDEVTVTVAEPTPEPTVEPTPEPTAQPTPEPTAQPTPEGSVAAETGTPSTTLPPTDSFGTTENRAGIALVLALLALAAAALMVTGTRAHGRR